MALIESEGAEVMTDEEEAKIVDELWPGSITMPDSAIDAARKAAICIQQLGEGLEQESRINTELRNEIARLRLGFGGDSKIARHIVQDPEWK